MLAKRKKRTPRTVEGVSQSMQHIEHLPPLQISDTVAVMTIDKFGRTRQAAIGEVWAVRSVQYVIKLIGAGDNVPIYYSKSTWHSMMKRIDYQPNYSRRGKKSPDYWLCKL